MEEFNIVTLQNNYLMNTCKNKKNNHYQIYSMFHSNNNKKLMINLKMMIEARNRQNYITINNNKIQNNLLFLLQL